MTPETIQSEIAYPAKTSGFASSVCDCHAYNIGIGSPVVAVSSRSITVEEYLSLGAEFSIDEMERYWRDYAIEPEYLFEFFKGQTERRGRETIAALSAEFGTGVAVSLDTSSDLSISVAQQLLGQRPEVSREIEGVIYYSATLNTRPAWSTPCRLHFELGLKCDTAFMIGQKGANVSYVALKVATEMLHAEGIHKLLLVGSERFAPPHSRVFSGLGVQGDSASAMLLGCGSFEYKLCCITLHDFFELPPHPERSSVSELIDFWSETAAVALRELAVSADLRISDIPVVLPPNLSVPLLRAISAKSSIPWDRFHLDALQRFGFLGSSDIAVNLRSLSQAGAAAPGEEILCFGLSSDGSVCSCLFRYEPQRRIS